MDFNLTQAGFFAPILEELEYQGLKPDRLLKQSNLDKFDLSDPEHYVPAGNMYQFLDLVSRRLGTPDLLENFADRIKLSCLAQWGEMIAYAPDLLSALKLAEQYGSVVNTHERTGFRIEGRRSTYGQKRCSSSFLHISQGVIKLDMPCAAIFADSLSLRNLKSISRSFLSRPMSGNN